MTKKTKKISALLMALALTLTSLLSTSSTAFASTLENANLSKTVKTTDINNNISISNDKLSAPLRAASNLRVEKGRTYLGHFTFHDKNTGLNRYYMGWHVRLCIAWKPADTGGDIDLNVNFFGKNMTFKCSEDSNGPDSDGYYYVTKELNTIYGDHSSIIYDAVTREGCNPPGYLRSGDVHTWVDVW